MRASTLAGHTRCLPVRESSAFQSRRRLKRPACCSVSVRTKCEHSRSSTGASARPGESNTRGEAGASAWRRTMKSSCADEWAGLATCPPRRLHWCRAVCPRAILAQRTSRDKPRRRHGNRLHARAKKETPGTRPGVRVRGSRKALRSVQHHRLVREPGEARQEGVELVG